MTQNPSRKLPEVFVLIIPQVIRILVVVVVVCCPDLAPKARRSVKILQAEVLNMIIWQIIAKYCNDCLHSDLVCPTGDYKIAMNTIITNFNSTSDDAPCGPANRSSKRSIIVKEILKLNISLPIPYKYSQIST